MLAYKNAFGRAVLRISLYTLQVLFLFVPVLGEAAALQPNATVINVKTFGAIGDGVADDTKALQSALDEAMGRTLYIPAGTYLAKEDLLVKAKTTIKGEGFGSLIKLDGAALVVSGLAQGGHVDYWSLRDFQVMRIGTVGATVRLTGDDALGANKGAIRGYTENLYVSGSTGDCIEFSNAYLITNTNLNLRNCAGVGLNMKRGPHGRVSANAIQFIGGEIQQNGQAIFADSVAGVTFIGTAIEGNKIGVELFNNNRSVSFINTYFEQNGQFDIRVGAGAAASVGIVVDNGYFADAASNKEHSIILIKGSAVSVRSTLFSGYSASAISLPSVGGHVKGYFENLTLSATPLASDGETPFFGERLNFAK
ncbi:MAG: glycosyl hydrolase family 28-related protein [Gallionella sp.]|nr:glycosyl hydrolase family 28-related protein [Gallionella sp.]